MTTLRISTTASPARVDAEFTRRCRLARQELLTSPAFVIHRGANDFEVAYMRHSLNRYVVSYRCLITRRGGMTQLDATRTTWRDGRFVRAGIWVVICAWCGIALLTAFAGGVVVGLAAVGFGLAVLGIVEINRLLCFGASIRAGDDDVLRGFLKETVELAGSPLEPNAVSEREPLRRRRW